MVDAHVDQLAALVFAVAAVPALRTSEASPMVTADPTCDNAGLLGCKNGFETCANLTGQLCDCRSAYVGCVHGLFCPETVVSAAYTSCVEAGCTVSNCWCVTRVEPPQCPLHTAHACGQQAKGISMFDAWAC